MHAVLTKNERFELLSRHKREKEKRIADRIKAVLLLDEGWSYKEIAKALFLDDNTVRLHIKKYMDYRKLNPAHKGSSPLLTPEESIELSKHLTENMYVKIKDIQDHIRVRYQKELAVSTIHVWLKNHKFSYKKPKLVPMNADPVAQEAFVKHYNKLMLDASLEGDPVLFGDSVHPTQQTRLSYGWVKQGQEKLIEVNSGRKRVNIMGAIMLETMHFVYKEFDTINGQSAIEFLKFLEKSYPNAKKIHLIWDRAGYHTCKEVEEYLITSRIKVHFLPPRSPNLNSIEPLWKVMHEHVSNNRSYKQFKDFKKALFTFFDSTMPNMVDVLVDRITDNFHIRSLAK
jgi:transposase